MPIVTGFEPAGTQSVRLQPTRCICKFRVGRLTDGRRVLQLDTHGSSERQEQGKQSQTLQIPEAQARALWDLIGSQFGFTDGKV